MRKGQLWHLLQHHQQPLVAVAVLNPNAVVTAVADKAVLWQDGRIKRVFKAPAVSVLHVRGAHVFSVSEG